MFGPDHVNAIMLGVVIMLFDHEGVRGSQPRRLVAEMRERDAAQLHMDVG